MKKAIIAVATAALVIASAFVGAAPASAVDGSIVIKVNGVWKAYLVYTSDDNRLCARTYNATKDAWSAAELTIDGQWWAYVEDTGGDQWRSCVKVSSGYEGRAEGQVAKLDGWFTNSAGTHYASYTVNVTI